VTREYLMRAHADHVLHAELFLGPQGHTARGVALGTVLEGVLRRHGCGPARRWHHQRPHPAGSAASQRRRSAGLLDAAMPWADRLLGFGLGGAEVGNPPSKFVEFFRRAASAASRW
jgi:adenosine deaminase